MKEKTFFINFEGLSFSEKNKNLKKAEANFKLEIF